MRNILKDVLLVTIAVAITGATAYAMESPRPEQHLSAQTVSSVQKAPEKAEDTSAETASTPPVEQPVEQTPAPAAEVVAETPAPAATTPKVDSTIPARVFCGSPAQRSWKTPLLNNATTGREMAAAKGWTGAQWSALLELWSCESSWNNFAQNGSSGAFGIAQFLDSTWGLPGMKQFNCSKTVDVREQVRCGLEYIAVVYGDPVNALAYHYRNNSY